MDKLEQYLNKSAVEVMNNLGSGLGGLNERTVIENRKRFGINRIEKKGNSWWTILMRQLFGNPLVIILAVATAIAFVLGQHISSYYIFGMILLSVILGFVNEYSAGKTIEKLLKHIALTVVVERNGQKQEIPASEVVVGDMVLLTRGTIVPADIRVVESKGLEINQSVLTGESKTSYKTEAIVDIVQGIEEMTNLLFMGTTVENGFGKGVVIAVGKQTEFGKVIKETVFTKPKTDFENGLASFGNLLVKVILVLTILVFVVNAWLGHQWLESLLFALAIAVGLTPELLPVIVTVSLSWGANKLAKKKVVAKQLVAIENLGNMDVLCTDKTGTLTEGNMQMIDYQNISGEKDDRVLKLGLWCNSALVHRKIVGDSIDAAIWEYQQKNKVTTDLEGKKIDEEPFDFERKAMFTVVEESKKISFLVKGAPREVLSYCTGWGGEEKLKRKIDELSRDGYRVVMLAEKEVDKKKEYSWGEAKEMIPVGYLIFLDTPKASVKEALNRLAGLSVAVKIITGDNELVTKKVADEVKMKITGVLIGQEMDELTDEELREKIETVNVFARMTPEQKLRVIQLLKQQGHTVGYLGDGVNDVPALRLADVGISVNSGVGVAKDAASMVLLQKSLAVIADGIVEGRRTFNNTIKYILMGTSSNFGNMVSAAGASFFLPFLPMTPVQILLTNGLYDVSQLSIPTDNVDEEALLKPKKWNIGFIRNYMMFFGPISSLYDFLTFGVMIKVFHATGALFQTGWFIESMATQILVVLVIRTVRTPFFLSKPSKWLLLACIINVGLAVLIPFSPLAATLGFVAPPPLYFMILIGMIITYLLLVEMLKKLFLRKI